MSSSKNGTASAGPEKRRPRAMSTTTTTSTTDPSPASTSPPTGPGSNPRRSDPSPARPPDLTRDLPPEERPRQRLLRGGGHALSDAEVLSVVLGGGSRGARPLGLARDLLADRGGLFGLVGVRPEALRRRGLGPAKAASVLAALELARRFARAEMPERRPLAQPHTVVRYLLLRYAARDQEVMGALYVDVRNRVVGEGEIYQGALSRTRVEPREILRLALLRGAAGLIVFHIVPSGDPSPSLENLAFTRRLAEAAEAVGVGLVDHLIVGTGSRWVSLRDRGAF